MTDEIQNVLVLSTSHLTKATADLLTSGADGLPVFFDKGEYGWWVHVPERTIDIPEACPADLRVLIWRAHQLDCHWVCLDRDGSVNSNLPTWEW